MPKKTTESDKVSKGFSIAAAFVELCKKHGLKFVLLCGLLAFIFIWLGIVTYDFYKFDRVEFVKSLIDEQTETLTELPSIDAKARYEATGKVNTLIRELLDSLDADRVSVCEYHNGKDNCANLPFMYWDMTYECVSKGTPFISDAYCDMSVSLYQIGYYLYKHNYLQCSIEEMSAAGKWPRFANKLEGDGVAYTFLCAIRNTSAEIGFIMVNWNETPQKPMGYIHAEVADVAMRLNTILDNTKHKRHAKARHGND